MATFDTAPLDPVFWLHHANIDRLWAVWLGMNAGHANPSSTAWLSFPFAFHDATGQPVVPMPIPSSVTDTTALGYTYEDVSSPLAAAPAVAHTAAGTGAAAAAEPSGVIAARTAASEQTPPPPPPELVGATRDQFALGRDRVTIAVDVGEATGPVRRSVAAGSHETFLHVEGVRGAANPGMPYGVYVNLPPDADPDTTDPDVYHAGNVALFGLELTNDLNRDLHGGRGLSYAFNITELVATQRARGIWDDAHLSVTFAPLVAATADVADPPPISVDRVSLYYR
jgi:tyrosinase